jgi:hypothetical protein
MAINQVFMIEGDAMKNTPLLFMRVTPASGLVFLLATTILIVPFLRHDVQLHRRPHFLRSS